jgi:HlyD family secretion protein
MDVQRAGVRKRKQRSAAAAAGAGVLVLLLLAVGLSLASRPAAVDGGAIWSGTVTRGELVHEITAAGTLVAPELRAVTNRSEGVVERIRVLPGQSVEPDDVLLDMSSPQLEEDLVNARWDLSAAEAEADLARGDLENTRLDIVAKLADAEAEYTSAKLELDAQQELSEQRIASKIDVERARVRADEWLKRLDAERARLEGQDRYRKAKLQAADAKVAQSREKVKRLETRVADLHIRAGLSGVVQEVNVQEGEKVAAGEAVARIVNPEHLIARVGVSERDAGLVKNGLPVHLELGRDRLEGVVTRVDPAVRDRLVTVDVALSSKTLHGLRPDLSVTARIELERVEDALILDRPAGLRDGAHEIELFRLSRSGSTAERVTVEIGRASARQVEILEGLDVGDHVILADLSDWQSHEEIRIR